MAEYMGSYMNACFSSESPKERVHICIGQCLSCPRSLQFNEQVVRFNFYGMGFPDIRNNLINQIRRHIYTAGRMDCFDFRSILKRTTITDIKTVLSYVHILYPKRKDFPDT